MSQELLIGLCGVGVSVFGGELVGDIEQVLARQKLVAVKGNKLEIFFGSGGEIPLQHLAGDVAAKLLYFLQF